MVHDDDALAFSGVGDFGFQPVELALADPPAISGFPALMAPAAFSSATFGGDLAIGMADRRREGADFVAIEHDEAPAMLGEAVIGRRHAEAGRDAFQMFGRDGEIVVAEQEEIVVLGAS